MSDEDDELICNLQNINDNKSERITEYLDSLSDKDELLVRCSQRLHYALDLINSGDKNKAIGLILVVINEIKGDTE